MVAEGTLYTTEILDEQLQYAREGLSDQIEAFADNTMIYLREEKELLLEGVGVPEVRTEIEGRHVLIVVRGLRLPQRPGRAAALHLRVQAAADGGGRRGGRADRGRLQAGHDHRRHGLLLRRHAEARGRTGGPRLPRRPGPRSGTDHRARPGGGGLPGPGHQEDAAMLLADSKGARLLVAVGTHASLVEFLDKGRAGMASTFLTRLRVGPKLVDAKGVSRIYRSQIKTWHLVLLVLSGVLALVTALLFTDVGSAVGSVIVARIRDLRSTGLQGGRASR